MRTSRSARAWATRACLAMVLTSMLACQFLSGSSQPTGPAQPPSPTEAKALTLPSDTPPPVYPPTDTPAAPPEQPTAAATVYVPAAPSNTSPPPPTNTSAPPAAAEEEDFTNVDSPPLPKLNFPKEELNRMSQIAQDNGLAPTNLAALHPVIYAMPDRAMFFLLPPAGSLGVGAEDLAANPARLKGVMLGGLKVVEQMHGDLPPGDYVLALSEDGSQVLFLGDQGQASYPATLHKLEVPLPRPYAMISARRMCIAWADAQVCALVDTPPPQELMDQVLSAASNFNMGWDQFNFDLAVPDMEGVEALQACSDGLSANPPRYEDCRASVLAVPAQYEGSFSPPDNEQEAVGFGLLIALNNLNEDVHLDRSLGDAAVEMNGGEYLMYDIILPSDPTVNGARYNRVYLTGPNGNYYATSSSGRSMVGQTMMGSGPDGNEEALILNLVMFRRCLFKWQRCRRI